MFVAYGLFDPRDPDHVRYIGVTSRTPAIRLQRHISDSLKNYPKGTKKENWIGSLLVAGVRPEIFVLDTKDSLDEIFDVEVLLVQDYSARGHNLTNGTAGGAGFDPDWVNKTGKTLRDLWEDPDWIAEHVAIFRRYWDQEENRTAQSKRVSEYFSDPANRQKTSEALKKYYAENPADPWSPERRRNYLQSEGYKRMVQGKQDEAYRTAMREKAEAQFSTTESRVSASNHAKRGWDSLTPDQRRDRILKGRLGTNLSWARKHGRVLEITPVEHICKDRK